MRWQWRNLKAHSSTAEKQKAKRSDSWRWRSQKYMTYAGAMPLCSCCLSKHAIPWKGSSNLHSCGQKDCSCTSNPYMPAGISIPTGIPIKFTHLSLPSNPDFFVTQTLQAKDYDRLPKFGVNNPKCSWLNPPCGQWGTTWPCQIPCQIPSNSPIAVHFLTWKKNLVQL